MTGILFVRSVSNHAYSCYLGLLYTLCIEYSQNNCEFDDRKLTSAWFTLPKVWIESCMLKLQSGSYGVDGERDRQKKGVGHEACTCFMGLGIGEKYLLLEHLEPTHSL